MVSTSSQSASPLVRSPSQEFPVSPPKSPSASPTHRSVSPVLLCTEQRTGCSNTEEDVAQPRDPCPPSPTFFLRRASERQTPRYSALPGRAAPKSGTCVSHFSLQLSLGRARHALPHSHRCPLERRPGARGARCAPRNLGAVDAKRVARIFLLLAARASAEQPPSATLGARSDPRLRPGRPAGSPLQGQSWLAPGSSCRRGLGARAGLRSAPRRAPHCSRQRAGGAGGGRECGRQPRG